MIRREDCLVHVVLDEKTLVKRRPEVEHERAVAIFDLLEDNTFALPDTPGPYGLHLRLEDNRLILDVRTEDDRPLRQVPLPLLSFRALVKDYFLICESYFDAIKTAAPSHIEAIDMGRRGLHDEGSQLLLDLVDGRILMDFATARRLFTLICVLHIRG
ncbi:MAG: hypothetical protein A2516_00890 [Alphaproteobacteria bacterium RIFOXYD12_FULL_60_8]|nr:MAG: hypothetical protein A2516_00890 [Alphaproteobacteria bacterium RIFOXYD12_FULL_60_8]